MKQRERLGPARNLSELASDSTLFLLIHSNFADILREMEELRSEVAVAGQPMKCSVLMEESRILTICDIVRGLSPPATAVLLFNVLAGKTIEIISSRREISRQIASALSIILPNNKRRDSTYFANVILSSSSRSTDFNHSLTVDASEKSNFQFSCRLCNSSKKGVDSYNNDASSKLGSCVECASAGSSLSVGRLLKILSCRDLNPCTLHTRILTTVEGILNTAKIWSKNRTDNERKIFLRKLNFAPSDAEILNFFRMFLV